MLRIKLWSSTLLILLVNLSAQAGEIVEASANASHQSRNTACDRATAQAMKNALDYVGISIDINLINFGSSSRIGAEEKLNLLVKQKANGTIRVVEKKVDVSLDYAEANIRCNVRGKFEITAPGLLVQAPTSDNAYRKGKSDLKKILKALVNAERLFDEGKYLESMNGYAGVLELNPDAEEKQAALTGIEKASTAMAQGGSGKSQASVGSAPESTELVATAQPPAAAIESVPETLDVSGTYRSKVGGGSIYVFRKRFRDIIVYFDLTADGLVARTNASSVTLDVKQDGNKISFTTRSSAACNCSYIDGVWEIKNEGQLMTGQWKKAGGSSGTWNLTKIN